MRSPDIQNDLTHLKQTCLKHTCVKIKKHKAVIHNIKVSPPFKKVLRYMFHLACLTAKNIISREGDTVQASGRLQNIKTIFPVWVRQEDKLLPNLNVLSDDGYS